jgi:hypothetical protein
VLTTPFLTDLDSRAAVKGSRDPLGLQQIWARFGRHVVGNLNTVSNSVRDFTVLLLGYYFAEQLAHELGPATELAAGCILAGQSQSRQRLPRHRTRPTESCR